MAELPGLHSWVPDNGSDAGVGDYITTGATALPAKRNILREIMRAAWRIRHSYPVKERCMYTGAEIIVWRLADYSQRNDWYEPED